MSAECYWCTSTDQDSRRPPLGTCSDCWVFTCTIHAERDANLGKWKCFDGVAKLISAAAGLDDADEMDDPPIASVEELEERFPRLAATTAAERERWSGRATELIEVARRTAAERMQVMMDSDPEMVLLGHAVGMVRHFLPRRYGAVAGTEARASGRLGRLLAEV